MTFMIPPSNETSHHRRDFVGAILVFAVVVCLVILLTFNDIPEQNSGIIQMIIGVMVGTITPVMFKLIGKDTDEVEALKKQNERLRDKNEQLSVRVDHLEEMLMKLQSSVIDKLADLGSSNNSK